MITRGSLPNLLRPGLNAVIGDQGDTTMAKMTSMTPKVGGQVDTGLRSATGPSAPWHSKPMAPDGAEYRNRGGAIKRARGGGIDGHAQAAGHNDDRQLHTDLEKRADGGNLGKRLKPMTKVPLPGDEERLEPKDGASVSETNRRSGGRMRRANGGAASGKPFDELPEPADGARIEPASGASVDELKRGGPTKRIKRAAGGDITCHGGVHHHYYAGGPVMPAPYGGGGAPSDLQNQMAMMQAQSRGTPGDAGTQAAQQGFGAQPGMGQQGAIAAADEGFPAQTDKRGGRTPAKKAEGRAMGGVPMALSPQQIARVQAGAMAQRMPHRRPMMPQPQPQPEPMAMAPAGPMNRGGRR